MEGNGDNKRWQTWAVVAPNAVSYRILDSRSAAAASEVLGDYAGTLLCDGYSAYESLKKRGGRFEIAHCWAHVRRKFVEAGEVAPAPAEEALALIGELYAAEKDCVSEDDRRRIREQRSRDIVRRIQEWALRQEALPRSPLRKAIAYMGDLWTGLLRFLDDPRLALDNNATERALRGVVVLDSLCTSCSNTRNLESSIVSGIATRAPGMSTAAA
jgi:transposase